MRISRIALVLSLFAGISHAQFIPETTANLPGQNLSNFLAKGDFNRDSKLDVLLSGSTATGQPELVVFPGTGTGQFKKPIVTAITGTNNPKFGPAGDLNGDGIPDAVITAPTRSLQSALLAFCSPMAPGNSVRPRFSKPRRPDRS